MVEEEQDCLSMITGLEGYYSEYSLSEFAQHLEADLSSVELQYGKRVFWMAERDQQSEYEMLYHHFLSTSYKTQIKRKIKHALENIESSHQKDKDHLIQFWAAEVDDGGHLYLTTSHQPFCVSSLYKGFCWYRKQCMDLCYFVEKGAKKEQLGAVGRVYRSKHPESSPDLRLYTNDEFPLRDFAALCGFKGYLVVPVFDLHNNECYGLLEILNLFPGSATQQLVSLNRGLKEAELRSTHIHFLPLSLYNMEMPFKYKQQPESEITKMLELAIKAVPQLHLAQVWVPCKQCANMTNNLSCMERATFINVENGKVNSCFGIDVNMFDYLQASEFHYLQIETAIARALMSSSTKSCFYKNLSDISISENPLAHYVQKARLSLYFALCLESKLTCDDIYIIEFFLQSNCGEDAFGNSLQLLLRIMEMELKSYKFALGRQLGEELEDELRQLHEIQHESSEYVQEMVGHRECYSELNFQKYLQTADLCCLQPSNMWVFCSPVRDKLPKNDFDSNLSLVTSSIKGKIEVLMEKIARTSFSDSYSMVQFWAPKMEEDRCFLATSDQPYALCCLHKGLALFRKQCMKHHYFVDEGAKEEELGPPGRVFQNGLPEITPDLRLYSTKEFSLRNHAVHCCLRWYNALPVFDSHEHKIVGVLELVGFSDPTLQVIRRALTEANLSSAHIDLKSSFLSRHLPANITTWRNLALTEVEEALKLVSKIPQVYNAEVWVPYHGCASINSNLSCLELATWTLCIYPTRHIHVPTRKGIAGMVLASENKSCLFLNSCDFSITEQPLAHWQRRKRLGVCFAICLQSSHTGNLLYVLQFFLNQGHTNYEYLRSFLKFLVPIMKRKLKSFKVASGKQLEEELVVELIGFSEADKLTFSELDQPNIFPFKFKLVQQSQKEIQHTNDQQMQYVSDGIDSVTSGAQGGECSTAAENSKKEDAAKKTEKAKGKTGLHLELKDLQPHFGRRLNDVAEELGVGRSTIKRVLRNNKITRWPNNKKYKKNLSLFMKENASETAGDSQQNMRPSSSGGLPPSDMPLHQNMPQTNAENAQNLTVQSEAEKVIIKVKYEDDIVRLDFCLSSGLDKLLEEVASKLKLEKGMFKLKYVDEDNDEILLACDTDLQHCPKSLTAVGKTCIHLFVKLIPR